MGWPIMSVRLARLALVLAALVVPVIATSGGKEDTGSGTGCAAKGILGDLHLGGPSDTKRTLHKLTELHRAAILGYVEGCLAELLGGTSVDVTSVEGLTPLHLAVQHQKLEVVEVSV